MEAQALTAPAGLRRVPSTRLLRLRSDDQLVAMFRLGHDDAFDALHDRYRARLLAYTRQMLAGSGADPEDALQDVFLRAFHALRADSRPVTIRAWLYRVAHNRCIDALRRPVTNDVELPDDVVALAGSNGSDPHADTQRRDDLRRLVEDIARLPEQQRSALLMREMSGMSYQELADALAVTVPAVKSLLVRARMGLVEAQEARDIACTEIRGDLESAHERGVRASGRSKRHLRECSSCRDHRDALKGVRAGLAALSPDVSGWSTLIKLLGIGGAGSAAGGASVAGGGAAITGVTATLGGGAVAATATKVVAVVAAAAVVGGGVNEVQKRVVAPPAAKAPAAAEVAASDPAVRTTAPAAAAAAVSAVVTATAEVAQDAKGERKQPSKVVADSGKAERLPMTPWTIEAPAVTHHGGATAVERTDADRAGGVLAPEDDAAAPAPATHAPAAAEQRPPTVQDLLTPRDKPAEPQPAPAAAATPSAPTADAGESEGETSATPGGAAAP